MSTWTLSVVFTPSMNTAFLKLRNSIQLQTATGNKEQHFYIFFPPERIASMTAEADAESSSEVHLRLMLKGHGDLISPVQSPRPSNELGKRLFASAQWLAARPGLAIDVHSRVSVHQWQHFCTACTDGLVVSDPDHSDVDALYAGQGGYVIDVDSAAESPPAYDGLVGMPSEAPQSSRKRQRIGSSPDPELVGKDLAMRVRDICDDIVARRQDELIVQLNARINAMQDRITDAVTDRMMDTLDERLTELRNDLLGEMDDDLDTRCDAIRGEMRDYMEEQAEEQVREHAATLEEEIMEKVAERFTNDRSP